MARSTVHGPPGLSATWWDAVFERRHAPGFRWLYESLGTNGRLTEMHAAIGRVQLMRMAEWYAARASNARRILDSCRRFSALREPEPSADIEHAWYKCYVFVCPERLRPSWTRDRIMNAITA